MARSLNSVFLIGNVGGDPDVKTTDSGVTVANLSLATSEEWKDKAGEKQERTTWHNLVAWRGLADICSQYVKKGDKLFVRGHLQTQTWEKEGQKHYKTVVVLDELIMLGGKHGEASAPDGPAAADDSDLPF